MRDAAGEVFVAGVMEHVEEAGVHSGDSACALPPPTLSAPVLEVVHDITARIADALGVVGLINVQYAVKDDEVFVLEANPRASRTVPFVAKATGVSLAQVAVRVMMGESLAALRASGLVPDATPVPTLVSVKEAVLPFSRFPGVDTVLGPEMRSTGEVMGIGESFGIAFAKSQLAAGTRLPDTARSSSRSPIATRWPVSSSRGARGARLSPRRDGGHGRFPALPRRERRHPRWKGGPRGPRRSTR